MIYADAIRRDSNFPRLMNTTLTGYCFRMKSEIDRRTPVVSLVCDDDALIELVYDATLQATALAKCIHGHITTHDDIDAGSSGRLVPITAANNLIRHRVVLLPEEPVPFISLDILIEEIDQYLYRYVDLSESFRKITAYYVLLSWVYDAFNELPYLRLRGDYGSGKTRALMVIGSICNKGFFASGASTVSPLFHIMDMFRGTLILDEADFRFSDEKAELIKILNNGNTRGFPVLRTAITIKKEFDPRAFNVFGPKIVAMRRSFEDPALESRFITEEMGQRSLRADIPINLPDRQRDEALVLRNKLLGYRFSEFHKVKIDESLIDTGLTARLNQILVPLLSIIEDEELRDSLRAVAHDLETEQGMEREASTDGQVLGVLTEALRNESGVGVSVGEITAAFIERHGTDYERPITSRYIGSVIRKRLHLPTRKSHGVYLVPVSVKSRVDILCKRYGVSTD